MRSEFDWGCYKLNVEGTWAGSDKTLVGLNLKYWYFPHHHLTSLSFYFVIIPSKLFFIFRITQVDLIILPCSYRLHSNYNIFRLFLSFYRWWSKFATLVLFFLKTRKWSKTISIRFMHHIFEYLNSAEQIRHTSLTTCSLAQYRIRSPLRNEHYQVTNICSAQIPFTIPREVNFPT